MDRFIIIFFCGASQRFRIRNNTVIRGEKADFTGLGRLMIFGTPLMVPETTIATWWQARIPLPEILYSFPSTAEMWSLCYALQMDRLTWLCLNLTVNKRQLETNCFKLKDGIMFMKFIFLSGTSKTHFLLGTLCPTIYCRKRYCFSEGWARDRKAGW